RRLSTAVKRANSPVEPLGYSPCTPRSISQLRYRRNSGSLISPRSSSGTMFGVKMPARRADDDMAVEILTRGVSEGCGGEGVGSLFRARVIHDGQPPSEKDSRPPWRDGALPGGGPCR